MPHTTPSELAKRFSDYHNATIAAQAAQHQENTMAKTDRKTEVIKLMKRKSGVTVDQIVEKTGMLPHSARALISGIGKTETVQKAKTGDKPTVYSIEVKESEAAA